MYRLNEFRDTLEGLEIIVGRDLIRNNGLAIILCLVTVANAGEEIDLASLAEKTDIQPTSLDRYVAILKDAGVIELQPKAVAEWGAIGISLTQRTRHQFNELLRSTEV
jgi:DNA-binding IclR family transcriptional regulator